MKLLKIAVGVGLFACAFAASAHEGSGPRTITQQYRYEAGTPDALAVGAWLQERYKEFPSQDVEHNTALEGIAVVSVEIKTHISDGGAATNLIPDPPGGGTLPISGEPGQQVTVESCVAGRSDITTTYEWVVDKSSMGGHWIIVSEKIFRSSNIQCNVGR